MKSPMKKVLLVTAQLLAGCDALASHDFDQLGLVRPDTIDLTIVRFAPSAQDALISNAIPLKPGAMQPGFTKNVRVIVNGAEQPIIVRDLEGRHSDGSVRSILIQFRYPLAGATPVSAKLIFTPAEQRTTDDPKPVVPSYTMAVPVPQAVALPTSAAYLIATGIVGPTASSKPAYNLEYEQTFTAQSNLHWQIFNHAFGKTLNPDQAIFSNYYDRALMHWAWWVRTGEPEYWKRAAYYLVAFRELGLKPNKYQLQPHNWQMEGLALHYLLTGDEENRQGIRMHADIARTIWLSHLGDPRNPYNEGRIQERVMQTFLAARAVGLTEQDYTALARTTLDRILASQSPDGSYRSSNWCNGSSNYMTGLANDVMIRYHETVDEDPRIIEAIRKSVDWMWSSQWSETEGGFSYVSVPCPEHGGTEASPDLNMLIVNGFGWMYHQTRDRTYQMRGDRIFREGVSRAYFANSGGTGDKQFNQNYRSSFRYLAYRK